MDKGLDIARRRRLLALHGATGADARLLARMTVAGGGADVAAILHAHGLAPRFDLADRALEWAARPGHHLLLLGDEGYPPPLREIAAPPLALFIAGEPARLTADQIAIVGSRKATAPGCDTARAIAGELAAAGVAVTSGLALGIDSAAHRGALDAGGCTVAVLGSGIDRIYPRRHQALAAAIAEAGALVSEFPLGAPPLPQHFPQRNRLISGLALGTVVIEAAIRSGSISTALHALEQGREVFAVPGSVRSPASKGCHALIKQGARLTEDASDIFDELP